MADPRHEKLAELLVRYSCAVEPGDVVLIEAFDTPESFVRALIGATDRAGGRPLLSLRSHALIGDLIELGNSEQLQLMGELEQHRMEHVDAYIGVRGNLNIAQWSGIPGSKKALYNNLYFKPVHLETRVPKTRWVALRWPTDSMAQQAMMSTQAFEDFFFQVCTLDYSRLAAAMEPLRELMERTDQVRLVAPGTDLRFSIQGIPAIPCDGRYNIPDGEVFTAPVRDSAEGKIRFNSPTIYQGSSHHQVELELHKGRIVNASSNNPSELLQILDSDDGARYLGEFAVGVNPHIRRPMQDILFDEKISGSVHLTPGNAYDEADNGNRSEVHWDLVLRLTEDAGGGEIYFDDRLVSKDGHFVLPELLPLNPQSLLA